MTINLKGDRGVIDIELSPTSILRIKKTNFTRGDDCSAVRHRNLEETKTSLYQPDDED